MNVGDMDQRHVAGGVELQQLILIEKSFAANSQVISALADMLDSLLAAAA